MRSLSITIPLLALLAACSGQIDDDIEEAENTENTENTENADSSAEVEDQEPVEVSPDPNEIDESCPARAVILEHVGRCNTLVDSYAYSRISATASLSPFISALTEEHLPATAGDHDIEYDRGPVPSTVTCTKSAMEIRGENVETWHRHEVADVDGETVVIMSSFRDNALVSRFVRAQDCSWAETQSFDANTGGETTVSRAEKDGLLLTGFSLIRGYEGETYEHSESLLKQAADDSFVLDRDLKVLRGSTLLVHMITHSVEDPLCIETSSTTLVNLLNPDQEGETVDNSYCFPTPR
jgi:hypothetical protein